MASSSKKSAKERGGSSSGKGGPSIAGGTATPRGSEDNSSSSDSVLGSPKPLGDILGRPTVDPWYKGSERFPSVLADWEWLVMRENAAVDAAWTQISGRSETYKYRGTRCLLCLSSSISSVQGLLSGRIR